MCSRGLENSLDRRPADGGALMLTMLPRWEMLIRHIRAMSQRDAADAWQLRTIAEHPVIAESIRGIVDDYANEKDVQRPGRHEVLLMAYAELAVLIQKGQAVPTIDDIARATKRPLRARVSRHYIRRREWRETIPHQVRAYGKFLTRARRDVGAGLKML